MAFGMEIKTKLRKCPFCGGEAEIISDSDSGGMAGFAVMCEQCHAMTAFYLDDARRAVRAWNTRCKEEFF